MPPTVASGQPEARIRHQVPAWKVLLAPLAVTLAVCLPKLWQGDFNVDTGWYSAIALQAYRGIQSGDWSGFWTLQGAGSPPESIPYFNKPPLAFWLNGLPLYLFGPTIWAARLGSVTAALLCIVATTLMVRDTSGPRAARSAGLVLALTVPFVGLARSFSLDLWMTTFLVGFLWAAVVNVRRGGVSGILPGAACLGAALVTKPVVPLLAVVPILAWVVWQRRWRASVVVLAMVFVGSIIVAVPWYWMMTQRYGEAFTGQFFGREMIDRAAAKPTSTVFNVGSGSPLYYLRALGESYWPWGITLTLAVASLALGRVARRTTSQYRINDRNCLVFGLIWTAVWLVAMSLFADKRPRYLAPLFPVWAWISALWLVRARWGAPAWLRRLWKRATLPLVLGAVAIGTAVSFAPVQVHSPRDAEWTQLLAWIDAHPGSPIYQGGFVGQRSARIYLHTGRWPIPTHGTGGNRTRQPPSGAFLLYHARDGLRPGPNESVVFESGKLSVTRLIDTPWRPEPAPDSGE